MASSGSANTPYALTLTGLGIAQALLKILNTGTVLDGTYAVGEVIIDPRTGFPFSHSDGNAQSGVLNAQLVSPWNLIITINGTGSSTHTYEVVAVINGMDALPGPPTTITTGASTPNNTIAWNSVPGATQYKVLRTAGGTTQGLIGTVGATTLTLLDNGLSASGYTAVTSSPLLPLNATSVEVTPQAPSTINGTTYSGTGISLAATSSCTIVFAGTLINRRVKLCNNTSTTLWYTFTGTAGNGSMRLDPSQEIIDYVNANTVSIYNPSSAAVTIGGQSAPNLYVEGGY